MNTTTGILSLALLSFLCVALQMLRSHCDKRQAERACRSELLASIANPVRMRRLW